MFDPALPAPNSPLSSAVMRSQLTSLKALIDALVSVDAAVVDGVETLNFDEQATVTVTVTANTLHFEFGIPQGFPGEPGPPGEVTLEQLTEGLDTRSYTVHQVSSLAMTADGEYSPTQLQEIIYKIDELLTALKGG